MDPSPDTPEPAPPPVTAMDRVQDCKDDGTLDLSPATHIQGHPDSFIGADDPAYTEAHRRTYELLGDAPSEPVPNVPDDPTSRPSMLGRLFLARDERPEADDSSTS